MMSPSCHSNVLLVRLALLSHNNMCAYMYIVGWTILLSHIYPYLISSYVPIVPLLVETERKTQATLPLILERPCGATGEHIPKEAETHVGPGVRGPALRSHRFVQSNMGEIGWRCWKHCLKMLGKYAEHEWTCWEKLPENAWTCGCFSSWPLFKWIVMWYKSMIFQPNMSNMLEAT